jgi:hypothetical protein
MSDSVHPLQEDVGIAAQRGSFGLSVDGPSVFVSSETFDACRHLHIKTAEALLNIARSMPSSIAGKLGWTVHDVQAAVTDAVQRLDGVVAAEYTATTPRRQMTYGAFPPLSRHSPDDRS